MVTNLPPQCAGLEKKYREATNLRDKILAFEEYVAAIPKHKGTEKLLQQLKTSHAKLQYPLFPKTEEEVKINLLVLQANGTR